MKSILFVGTLGVSDAVRLIMPAEELAKREITTAYVSVKELDGVHFRDYGIVVFNRPVPPTRKIIQICKHLGIKVVIDQDDDFRDIPKTHVAYRSIGPGNPNYLDDWLDQLSMADLVTVSTPILGERLSDSVKRYMVIPNGWSISNPIWTTSYPPRSKVTIGWAGTITHRIDFALVQKSLLKILKKNTNVRILIGLDKEIYKVFEGVPETQKVFYPQLAYPIYPYLLRQMDILIAPLVDDRFNQGKSDIKLVEAGAASVPWIASPVAPYESWAAGGILTQDGTWENALSSLIEGGDDYRKKLGTLGHDKALSEREAAILVEPWVKIIEEL